jgi:uncharacterized membrane protein/mono/diheme cytochrome c family protein
MDFIYFLGRFHVLLLHIPITLALAVVVLDWLSRREKYEQFEPVVPPLWAAAAISAVATAVLGYMHFSEGGFTGPSADAHRALGTSVAFLTTLVWAARSWSLAIYRRLQTAVGLTLVALVTATGHLGGNLTHGDAYLVQYAPRALQRVLGFQVSRPPVKDIAAADPYLDIVRPIFEQRCFSCHNTGKQRGELNLTSYDAVMKGGKNGAVIIPGNPNGSDMYRRINLPAADKNAMPAEDKTPLTEGQKAIIAWWIQSGAKSNVATGDDPIPPGVQSAISAQLGLSDSSTVVMSAPGNPDESPGPPIKVSPQILERLVEAGFMARQDALSDERLMVSAISPGSQFSDEQLERLAGSGAKIGDLALERTGLTDSSAPSLARLQDLARLRLDNNKLTDKGIAALVPLRKLEYLNIYGNPGVTDASVATLAQLPALREVYLWGTSVSPDGVEKLRQQRPELRVNAGNKPVSVLAPPGE